jgi:predicted RNase H-like HicB family nuclease
MMKLAMEVFLDEETKQWGYGVPALSIVGTGCASREEARELGYQAIRLVLEAAPSQPSPGAEVVLFDVEVTPEDEAS